MKRPLPFGLNSCMTQQNKGISKTFYYIRKKQSSLPWNKVKAPKKFAIWSFSSSNSSSSISGSSRTKKKEEKDTQSTRKKKKQRTKTDKKMRIFCHFQLYFKVRNSVLSYVVKFFWYDPFLSVLTHVWRSRIRAYQKLFTT